MGKQYKVTYKVYFNKRLKKVSFHEEETLPVYIQLTFKRRTTIFKSYYFDLLSQSRYATQLNKINVSPSLQNVVMLEEKVLDYLAAHATNESTIENLQKQYYFYSTDLCMSSEERFRLNLFMFLLETGSGAFAKVFTLGSKSQILFDVLKDMELLLNKDAYEAIASNGYVQHEFYLSLYGFVKETKKPPYYLLSVMEWLQGNTREAFLHYLEKSEQKDAQTILDNVDKWVNYIK